MKRAVIYLAAALIPAIAPANEAALQIEEVVVTGAVRANNAIQIADIHYPGDADLAEIPEMVEP